LRWLGFKTENPKLGNYRIPNLQIVLNGLLVFGLYVQYLIYEIDGNLADMGIIFALGFSGTLGLGFISDQKLWGYRLNVISSIILASVYFIAFRINDIYLETNIILILLSNLIMYFSVENVSLNLVKEDISHSKSIV
jgi:hypothetical protein